MSTTRPTAAVITAAILTIVDEQGLERATVREVAARAEVSIGTVQHHFPTKDAMLVAAFTEVVRRVRARLVALTCGHGARRDVMVVLEQILPLDQERAQEARVQLAFAARAIHEPALASIQESVLAELHQAVGASLSGAGGLTVERADLVAHGMLALADGLALHAVSTDRWLSADHLDKTLELISTAVIPDDARP